MCKELPVILVNKVVDPKKNNRKIWRAKEEERLNGSLTKKNELVYIGMYWAILSQTNLVAVFQTLVRT
jgi:hypothetical protein